MARWALAAVALCALWLCLDVAVLGRGDPSVLFLHGRRLSLPPELAESSRIVVEGYDGQFYRILAHDPWFEKGYAKYVDAPALRARRILLPGLAWMLAGGRREWIDSAFVALSLASVGLGVWALGGLAESWGRAPVWGLAFLAWPVTMLSLQRMLSDGLLAALLVSALWCARAGVGWGLYVSLTLAALCKETGLLFIAGFAVAALLRRSWKEAAMVAATAIPFLAWAVYVASKTAGDGFQLFSVVPFRGFADRLF